MLLQAQKLRISLLRLTCLKHWNSPTPQQNLLSGTLIKLLLFPSERLNLSPIVPHNISRSLFALSRLNSCATISKNLGVAFSGERFIWTMPFRQLQENSRLREPWKVHPSFRTEANVPANQWPFAKMLKPGSTQLQFSFGRTHEKGIVSESLPQYKRTEEDLAFV